MERSENINELAAALAKAQGAMSHAVKDSLNPGYKSRYADLASVWEACRKPLADNGLSVTQLPEPAETGLRLNTILMHTSGQFISSQIQMPLMKADPQGYGSALTYARRYALAAIVGVYQDDDDANSATEQHNKAAAQQPVQSKPEMASEAQVKAIFAKGSALGMDNAAVIKTLNKQYGISKLEELSKRQASEVLQRMNEAAAKKEVAATETE